MEPSFDHVPRTVEVDVTATDFYKPIVNKYLTQTGFPEELINTSSFAELASQMDFDDHYRNVLADEIIKQYADSNINLNESSLVFKNIELLRKSSTFTVTTGQQIHIFLGPLFVVNKILSCCADARSISEQLPENDVVPVFWMASEDHDFDEIKSVRLYNETYTWDLDANGPVGRLSPQSLLPLVEQAKARIDQTEENLNFLNLCETAYTSCYTFAQATRYILHALYEDLGIVLFDADAQTIKRRLTENIKADLFKHENAEHIDASIKVLKSHKVKAPINTRPINYFMLHEGGRYRITTSETGFQLVGHDSTWSAHEMDELIDQHPERFSPNALLRPIFQQLCLPNLVYICGGSEFIYWLELKKAMESANAVFPTLFLRKSNFILSGKNAAQLEAQNFNVQTLFLNNENFDHFFVTKTNKNKAEIDGELSLLSGRVDRLIQQLEEDRKGPLTKGVKLKNQLFNLLETESNRTYISDIRTNADYNRINKIKNKVWSETYVQERNTSILTHLDYCAVLLKVFKNDYNVYTNQRNLVITII